MTWPGELLHAIPAGAELLAIPPAANPPAANPPAAEQPAAEQPAAAQPPIIHTPPTRTIRMRTIPRTVKSKGNMRGGVRVISAENEAATLYLSASQHLCDARRAHEMVRAQEEGRSLPAALHPAMIIHSTALVEVITAARGGAARGVLWRSSMPRRSTYRAAGRLRTTSCSSPMCCTTSPSRACLKW